ncbi:hypothetical protein niasHS_002199 [Heterodera schachtii]|uniref:C2H2-type domain-containing protein n=1 Tax=Heterodera schachtii TaxID=97005 RepID=A0ABD2KN70_HETSC
MPIDAAAFWHKSNRAMAAPFPGGHSSSNVQSPVTTPSRGQQTLSLAAALVQQQQQSGTNTPNVLQGMEQQLQQTDLRSLQLQQQFTALMQSQPQQPPAAHAHAAHQTAQQNVHQHHQQQQASQLSSAFLPHQQHLLEGTAQSSNASGVPGGAPAGALPSASTQLSAATVGFYQQLLALQQAQQQQQHGGGAGGASGSASAAATPAVATLPQQFNTALHLQNSPASSVLPQQLAPAPSGAPHAGLNVLLGGLVGSNPSLLHSLSLLAGGAAATAPTPGAPTGGTGNALLTALATQLLLPQQQQQQQIVQPSANHLTAALLQMLNPATATLYAYQSYLQQHQQQPQTPAPAAASVGQLQLLAQLLAGGGVSTGTAGNCGVSAVGSGLHSALSAFPGGGQQQNLLTALAVQQAAQPQQQQQQPTQQEETRILLEQLIRQQQQGRDQQQQQQREREQQLKQQQMLQQQLGRFNAAAVGAISSEPQAPQLEQSPTMTATAVAAFASAQEQMQQQQQQTATAIAMEQQQQQQQNEQFHQQQQQSQQTNGNALREQQQTTGNAAGAQPQQQQRQATPNERLLTSEALQDRISRLISENEAIVEPNPVLLKRRPYQRQGTSNSMTSQTSETAGTSQRCSPGVRSPGVVGATPKVHPATTRSFSLHEAGFLRFGGGSLTSGQPINRNAYAASLTCNFCQLKFPNEAGLEAHEPRCSKKYVPQQQQPLQKQQSQPQLKLPSQQQQFQQQLHQQLEHQSTIAALVGGGKGVARDLIINGGAGGRASVPSGNNGAAATTAVRTQQSSRQLHLLGQSNSDSRLKKRGLAAEDSHTDSAGSGGSAELTVDVTRGGAAEPGLAESSKMARIECSISPPSADVLRQHSFSSVGALFQHHAQIFRQRSGSQETQRHVQQQQDEAGRNVAPQQQQHKVGVEQHHPQQQQNQPVLTMRDAVIFAITYSTDLRPGIKMPYFLTLTAAELETGADLAAGGAATVHLRGRTRNITSETFVCLNKLRPRASEQRDNCSSYSFGWPPPPSDPLAEERLLAQLFLCTRTTARVRQDSLYGDYTLAASPASTQLRTTHSSFWTQQQQQLKAQQQHHAQQRDNPLPQQQLAMEVVEKDETPKREPTLSDVNSEQQQNNKQQQGNGTTKVLARTESMAAKQQQNTDDDDDDGMAIVKKEMGIDNKENSSGSSITNALKVNNEVPRKATTPLVPKAERKSYRSKFELNSLTIPKSSHNEEMEVYIRGRGRGRYVCERCGIRCKKPSMLKKHLRSHTNIRPFACLTCNFSFKTKGNLTKHLVSKAHRRKVMDTDDGMRRSSTDRGGRKRGGDAEDEEEEGEGRLVVAEEEDDEEEKKHRRRMERWDRVDDWDDDDDDDEEEADDDEEDEDGSPNGEVPPPPPGTLSYRRFGQENVLVERETHTPPTLWTLCPEQREWGGNGCPSGSDAGKVPTDSDEKAQREDEDGSTDWERAGNKKRSGVAIMQLRGWPEPDEAVRERGCHSAPPAALCSPDHSRARRRRNHQAKVLKRMQQKQREIDAEALTEAADAQRKQPQSPPPPLANFIPQMQPHVAEPHHQQLQQQPSLAAQLAVGLLASAPFHHHQQGMPIGVAYPYGIAGGNANIVQQQNTDNAHANVVDQFGQQQQQLMFSPLEHHQHTSAFAPPTLASASLLLDSAVSVGLAGHGTTTTLMEAANNAFVANDSLLRGQSTLGAFLATDAQQFLCSLCGRKFRKESELSLHKQTHLIEQNAAVARQKGAGGAFQCGDCSAVVRSKALLARHSESVHGVKAVASDEVSAVPCRVPPLQPHLAPSVANSQTADPSLFLCSTASPSASLMLPPSVATAAPGGSAPAHAHHRNFLCTDCNLGFRSHGVLAKHLRSKNHVKTLVSLGKLPEEANHLLAKEHSKALGSIDAGDCEKALHSTKQLLAKMREQLGLETATAGTVSTTTSISGCSSAASVSSHPTATDYPAAMPSPTILPPTPTTNATANAFLDHFAVGPVAETMQFQQNNAVTAATGTSHAKLRISNSISAQKRTAAVESLPHGLKRKNDEATLVLDEFALFPNSALRRDAFSSPLPSRAKISREEQISQAESPLHSLAQVAVEVAAAAAAAVASAGDSSSAIPSHTSAVCPSAVPPPNSAEPQQKPSTNCAANVWVPPKLEQLTEPMTGDCRKSSTPDLHNGQNGGSSSSNSSTDRLGTLLSNRSAEETSESTGTRSESSTPVQRSNAQQPLLGFAQAVAATRCQLCDQNFDSPSELAVHFHADHVVMRHGRDFRCSRRNCEKVFPSRESLRAHIHAHFFGGGATPGHSGGAGNGRGEEQFQTVLCAASCPASPSMSVRPRHPPAPSAPPPCAQSPGVPEESHTMEQLIHHDALQSHSSPPSVASVCFVSGGNGVGTGGGIGTTQKGPRGMAKEQQQQQQQQASAADKVSPPSANTLSSSSVPSLLNCQFCGAQLADVQALQTHWLQQHVAQLARPHVCVDCDAGFTTAEALRAHREMQHAEETARKGQRISSRNEVK